MKLLHMEIEFCGECPFCRFDMQYDVNGSGWLCLHSESTVLGVWKTVDVADIDVVRPEWCPLPDVEETK